MSRSNGAVIFVPHAYDSDEHFEEPYESECKQWDLQYRDEIEVDELVALRAALKPVFEAEGVKLSYMPMILKATSLALAAYPQVNASVADDESSMTYHVDHNIAIAMDTPRGLLVPNVKRVQEKSLLEIAADLNELQARRGARRARAAPAPRAFAPPRDASPDRARALPLLRRCSAPRASWARRT